MVYFVKNTDIIFLSLTSNIFQAAQFKQQESFQWIFFCIDTIPDEDLRLFFFNVNVVVNLIAGRSVDK